MALPGTPEFPLRSNLLHHGNAGAALRQDFGVSSIERSEQVVFKERTQALPKRSVFL